VLGIGIASYQKERVLDLHIVFVFAIRIDLRNCKTITFFMKSLVYSLSLSYRRWLWTESNKAEVTIIIVMKIMIIMMQKLGSLARTSWKLPDKLSDLSPHLSFSNGSFWASSIWDRDFRVFGYLSYVYGELGFLNVSGLYWLEMLINSGLLSWKLPSKRRNQCFETERQRKLYRKY
jgi:hypothetical protein